LATADEIIEAFLRGVAEGAKQNFPTAEQAGKSIGRRVTGAYSKAYGKHFKKVQGKYKKKNGSWKQDGFKRAQAEAHRLTRKEMKK